MSKNVTRSILVAVTILFTISLGQKLDKFLSVLGAISCTPIAFTIPALFHYKVAAETKASKYYDMTIIAIFIFI